VLLNGGCFGSLVAGYLPAVYRLRVRAVACLMDYKPRPYNKWNDRRERNRRGGTGRRLMLDMGRQKYFRMDLDDLLESLKLGENKSILAATVLNKMSSHSFDEACDYLGRVLEGGKISEEQAQRIKALMQRYTKWR